MDQNQVEVKKDTAQSPSTQQPVISSDNSTGLILQIILMFITLSVTGYIFYKPLFNFTCNDPMPEVKPLDKNLITVIQKPNLVKVGLFIYGFSKFDILNDNFTFDGILFFEFDPTILNLERISKFSFKNGNILYKSEPQIKLNKDLVFVRYDIKAEIKSGLNYKLFPFASHRLNIVLDNNFLYIEEMAFKAPSSKFIVNPEVHVSGWQEHNKEVLYGYYNAQFQKFKSDSTISHPRVAFIIEYLNNSTKEILSIFLPLFMMFFMAVFSFGLDPIVYFHQIVGLASGSVTGMLSYRYVIHNISPKVEYFMISDIIYFTFLGLIIFIFLCSCQMYDLTKKHKIFLSIFCNGVVIATFIYVFKIWNKLE